VRRSGPANCPRPRRRCQPLWVVLVTGGISPQRALDESLTLLPVVGFLAAVLMFSELRARRPVRVARPAHGTAQRRTASASAATGLRRRCPGRGTARTACLRLYASGERGLAAPVCIDAVTELFADAEVRLLATVPTELVAQAAGAAPGLASIPAPPD